MNDEPEKVVEVAIAAALNETFGWWLNPTSPNVKRLADALRSVSVVPAEPATHDTPRLVGKAKTNPATLYMDGTSPVTVMVQATTDELRALHNQTVTLAVVGVDGEVPAEPATHDTLRQAAQAVLTCCRECRDQEPPVTTLAEFILWGKLLPPEALGPKCYDHAVKHLGHSMPTRPEQYAVVDLRPIRAAVAVVGGEAPVYPHGADWAFDSGEVPAT